MNGEKEGKKGKRQKQKVVIWWEEKDIITSNAKKTYRTQIRL